MNKPIIAFIVLLALGLIVAFTFTSNPNSNYPDDSPSNSQRPLNDDNVQIVTLSYKNYNYYPQQVTVKEGIPVRVYLDNTVGGCYRSFMIRDFDVSKYIRNSNDYVEFTPDKKGSFIFSCSMGMGTGKLIVE